LLDSPRQYASGIDACAGSDTLGRRTRRSRQTCRRSKPIPAPKALPHHRRAPRRRGTRLEARRAARHARCYFGRQRWRRGARTSE